MCQILLQSDAKSVFAIEMTHRRREFWVENFSISHTGIYRFFFFALANPHSTITVNQIYNLFFAISSTCDLIPKITCLNVSREMMSHFGRAFQSSPSTWTVLITYHHLKNVSNFSPSFSAHLVIPCIFYSACPRQRLQKKSRKPIESLHWNIILIKIQIILTPLIKWETKRRKNLFPYQRFDNAFVSLCSNMTFCDSYSSV